MTSDEDEDTTRYHFAKCSLLLRALADNASQAFCEGRPITEQELRQVHDDLNQVWHMVLSETRDGIAPDNASGDPWDLVHYHCKYTDGTSAATMKVKYHDPVRSVPLHFREREITHLASCTIEDFCLGEPFSAGGVDLMPPPHDRPCDSDHGVNNEAARSAFGDRRVSA